MGRLRGIGILLLPLFSCQAAFLQDGAIRGIVRDAQTGEPLSRVAVQLVEPQRQALTAPTGIFDLGPVEFFAQKRTANRLTGWVSYAFGYSRLRDGVTGAQFPSDQDQRHTVNVYLGYRIRPSVNLSAKWTYGSGFPVPGFFSRDGDTYYLSETRNGARMDAYQRADFRINKSRAFDRWKITVYGEVVNVMNRPNYRFDSYNGFDPRTGRAYLSFSNMFPVLPSAGVMLEF